MRRTEKAARIWSILDDLYPSVEAPLKHTDPYSLLVAVLLSAQCTDVRVNIVAPKLFARAATPQAMIELDPREIEDIIRTCGLAPRKSKNIWELSRLLISEHGGDVPRTLEALETLPGVGHKTASVVVGHAFGIPAFPVDTHIHRLAGRWGLSKAKNVVQTERDLKALSPPDTWHKRHLQIIFFGREHCPALFHDLSTCPICGWAATKKRRKEEMRDNNKLRKRKRRGSGGS